MATEHPFTQWFRRWARVVRAQLALRFALTGLAFGLVGSGALATALWWQRMGTLRPWAIALALGGALIGGLWAVRRRWSDNDIALFLDARLRGEEGISTALELLRPQHAAVPSPPAPVPSAEQVKLDAVRVLSQAKTRDVRVRWLCRVHGLAPFGAGLFAWASLAPLPPAPAGPAPAPGESRVQVLKLRGLDTIANLESLDARDAAQRQRLTAIAREARRLQEELRVGLPLREAQARVAQLRDDIAAEKLAVGNQENRAGLEAAVGKLGTSSQLKDAARALGNGDIVEFDREMQRLASAVEQADRDRVREALEQAAQAAREKGARSLAQTLAEQKRAFERQERRAEALRELSKALEGQLGSDGQDALKGFEQQGSPEAQRRLADALGRALEGLSEEERQRLAENLKRSLKERAKSGAPAPPVDLDQLAEELSSKAGREALKEALRQMAEQDPSEEAERQRRLDDAERGGDQAQKELGVIPLPGRSGAGTPGPTNPPPKGTQRDPARADNGTDQRPGSGTGSSPDRNSRDVKGETAAVPGDPLRSKARVSMNGTVPLQGSSFGRTTARPGETANQLGTEALGQGPASDLGGANPSEVPEEYREQVGRYFQP